MKRMLRRMFKAPGPCKHGIKRGRLYWWSYELNMTPEKNTPARMIAKREIRKELEQMSIEEE